MTEGTAEAATPAAAEPRRHRFAALEVPRFRWYWAVSWVSQTGDGMENVIRNLLVLQLTGAAAPLWLGLMVFAHWVPFTLFSLYGGVLADRHDARKVQLVAQILLMTAAGGVAIATIAGFVTEWWIFGFLLLHGFAGAIGNPAQQTLIHSIVGRERLLSAVSLNSSMRQFSQVIGPAVAGFIYVLFGPGWGFAVNAMTFVPLLVFLVVVRIPRVGPPAVRQHMVAAVRESLRFLRERPSLGALILVEMLPVIFLGHTFNSLLPLFARDQLHVDAVGYSFLLVASGLGAVGAATLLAYSRIDRSALAFVIGAAMLEMAAMLAFALSGSYAVSFALMAVIGGTAVLAQSLANTTLQLSAPDAIRGRVMGTYSFGTQGMRVVNGPVLGGLAQAFGPATAVAGSALVVIAALGAFAVRFARR